jgi:hypothetical protein
MREFQKALPIVEEYPVTSGTAYAPSLRPYCAEGASREDHLRSAFANPPHSAN